LLQAGWQLFRFFCESRRTWHGIGLGVARIGLTYFLCGVGLQLPDFVQPWIVLK